MMSKVEFATIGLRILGVLMVAVGLVLLVANVLESAWDFNPNYLGFYFMTQLLRPMLWAAGGALVLVSSKIVGKLIAKC
jgi:NAD(P)-dependent dehydrogenase (short-subunit alcohol dehydrogenase family)